MVWGGVEDGVGRCGEIVQRPHLPRARSGGLTPVTAWAASPACSGTTGATGMWQAIMSTNSSMTGVAMPRFRSGVYSTSRTWPRKACG